MNKLTTLQKLKHLIIIKAIVDFDYICPSSCIAAIISRYPTSNQIEDVYDDLHMNSIIYDIQSGIRQGEEDTLLSCPSSRHYESKSVAVEYFDGSWIGWTYWYGGGKHGEPDCIDWMEDCYDIICDKEEKRVIIKTFTKKEKSL
jgi:hypothetical protein